MCVRWAHVSALLLLAGSCWGQSARRIEVYGGYSFAARDFSGGMLSNGNTTLNRGWNASANIRLNPFSQLVADAGGYYLPGDFCFYGATSCSSSVRTLMFGPQFSFRRPGSNFTPFAHALIGVALASQHNLPPSLVSNQSFLMAFGGGVDYKVARHFGLRGQADYLRTHITNGDNQVPFKNNNARVSVGAFVRF